VTVHNISETVVIAVLDSLITESGHPKIEMLLFHFSIVMSARKAKAKRLHPLVFSNLITHLTQNDVNWTDEERQNV
jgi:hypothetical protein